MRRSDLRMCRYCREHLSVDRFPGGPPARVCESCRADPGASVAARTGTRACLRCGETKPREEYRHKARICDGCKAQIPSPTDVGEYYARRENAVVVGIGRGAGPRREWLPAGPFAARFAEVLARELWSDPGHQAQKMNHDGREATVEHVCVAYGFTARAWQRWRSGESRHIDFATVDGFLTRTGLNYWDVWDPDEYPDVDALLGGVCYPEGVPDGRKQDER